MKNRITTIKGVFQGIPEGNCVVYKGIPYAKPPVGELRWKAPVETDAWDGVFYADHFAPMCVQDLPSDDNPFTAIYLKEFYENPDFLREGSEDCLYLNIWVPKEKKEEKLPVAFWIHGGGFAGGYSSELEFDGAEFCRRDVILVTICYRLGLFGYFAHPWLDAESEHGVSGNYGTQDQIAALKWVYENIEAFGGDPENITVFGQSAGCMSTQNMISSPLTGDIPKKAIFQSGLTCEEEFLYTPTLKEEEELCQLFVDASGCKNLEELRALPAEKVNELKGILDAKGFETGIGLCVVPNADGYVLPDTVKDAYRKGTMKKIPYMAGYLSDDLATTPEQVAAGQPGLLMNDAARWSLKCEELGLPSYVYHFAHPLPRENGETQPPFHSTEIWYMFGTLGRSWRPMQEDDYAISAQMMDYWCNFMRTGNPNGDGLDQWNTYTKENPEIKVF